jgi:hypothetical protein
MAVTGPHPAGVDDAPPATKSHQLAPAPRGARAISVVLTARLGFAFAKATLHSCSPPLSEGSRALTYPHLAASLPVLTPSSPASSYLLSCPTPSPAHSSRPEAVCQGYNPHGHDLDHGTHQARGRHCAPAHQHHPHLRRRHARRQGAPPLSSRPCRPCFLPYVAGAIFLNACCSTLTGVHPARQAVPSP